MQTLGWSGTTLFIIAYMLLNMGRWTVRTNMYHIFNILGSILLVANTIYDASWAATFANLFWGLVAIYGLVKFWHADVGADT